jgi:hypothetical protein
MAMKPKKMRGGGMVKKMRGGGMVKKMPGGGMANKPEMMKDGGVSVTDLRKMAKDKGYKLVKD